MISFKEIAFIKNYALTSCLLITRVELSPFSKLQERLTNHGLSLSFISFSRTWRTIWFASGL